MHFMVLSAQLGEDTIRKPVDRSDFSLSASRVSLDLAQGVRSLETSLFSQSFSPPLPLLLLILFLPDSSNSSNYNSSNSNYFFSSTNFAIRHHFLC
mmetsp:Transcript_84216/g.184872  ORF Transcript_84216/g.184872 Transcript_84216/m.184872 type:complete len:96 (-) Transcript_84216:22-309(-)